MKKIDGKKIADKIKKDLAHQIYQDLKKGHRHPSLAIILAGERKDSQLYVSLKEKAAQDLGIDTSLYIISEHEGQEEIISLIKFLNQDPLIDGILVQLPLPERFKTEQVLSTISSSKNVDGFDLKNRLFSSPLLKAVWHCLEETQEELLGKRAFLFFNSPIFAQELERFLKSKDIYLDSIASEDFLKLKEKPKSFEELKKRVKSTDIVISALGWPEFIKSDFLKDKMILIDIGISKKGNKTWGDFKYSDSQKFLGHITPVPGGIGPITVVSLLENVFKAYQNERKNVKN